MRMPTFYMIVDDHGKVVSSRYALSELIEVKKLLSELALKSPGLKFHLMKRVSSVVASDLSFEDSE